jgi:D-cysteine desulfhydrase
LPRAELGFFPSATEHATSLLEDGRLWIKRDDDFTRPTSHRSSFALARTFGGGKVRKLELYFGEARAQGKHRIITCGGVGSNQALATALLGSALGFSVRLHLAPQPPSSLTAKNLAGDAASHAEMRMFDSVAEAHAQALRDAKESGDTYVIPPGGTTPLGTLGFVNAGFELAADVRAGRLPAPRRIYVALGLGGTAAGLGIGCALGGLQTEIVAVRTSNPGTVSAATLRAIHDETIAFARARDPRFVAVKPADANVRIDGRFVGTGYGAPTPAGTDAIARAERAEGWALDPVYTGKALAALLDDVKTGAEGPLLFWNTMSSRPVAVASVPVAFQRYVR